MFTQSRNNCSILIVLILVSLASTIYAAEGNSEHLVKEYNETIAAFKQTNNTLSFEQGRKVLAAFKGRSELKPENFNYMKEYIYVLYTFPKNIGGDRNIAQQLLEEMAINLPFESHVLRFYLFVETGQSEKAKAELEKMTQFEDRSEEIKPLYKLIK